MDASIVLQIPVDTRSNVHPVVASHHDFLPSLIQLEEVLLALYFLNLKLGRSAFVNTFQKVIHRIGPCLQGHQNCNNS